ncbi:MAG TPA: hypothetical protein DGK91_10090 [Clostridium sp.]|jgi:uncharacterized protein (DUF58 family)|nr:DUF58 domain-containing protein [Clostridia bacterium]HCW04827.1 hypothetical protein [Clostridium sp.]
MFRINIRFLILLILFFVLAYIEGGPLFYRVFYSVVAILLISIVVIISNRKNLNLDILFERSRYSAGDLGSFKIVLKNKGWIPVSYLLVNNSAFKKLSSRYNGDAVYIGSKKSKSLEYQVRFRIRGTYDFSHTDLWFRDTASIIKSHKVCKNKVFIQVYPKIIDIPPNLFNGINLFNDYKLSSSGIEDPYAIKDNRKYKAGDNLNRINWKVSAKYNELYVKNHEVFIGEEFNFFLDMNSGNYQYDINGISEEQLIDFSASVIHSLTRKAIVSKLYINAANSRVFHVREKREFAQLMDYLMRTKSDGKESFTRYLKAFMDTIITMNNVAFITSRVDQEFYEFILDLESRKKNLFVFYNKVHKEDKENIDKLMNLGVKVVNISKFI